MTEPTHDEPLRRHFAAVATSKYKDPRLRQLEDVPDEVAVMRDWVTAESLGSRRFTEVFAELGKNPSEEKVRKALKRMGRWNHDDAAFIYVTGHGKKSEGMHWLLFRNADAANPATDGIPTVELLRLLKASQITHLVLIIDTCFAGAVAGDALQFDSELPSSWLLLGSVSAYEEATVGELARSVAEFLAEEAIGHGSSRTRKFSADAEHFRIDYFVQSIEAKLGKPLTPLGGSALTSRATHRCLPNPCYRPSLTSEGVRAIRADDLRDHWSPRSRGVAEASEDGWFFQGRKDLMRRMVAAFDEPPANFVVTGVAGSGKSAVLSRLVTLADAEFVTEHATRLGAIAADLRPRIGSIDAAVIAEGRSPIEIMHQICEAIGARIDDVVSLDGYLSAWHEIRSGRDRPITVVIDSLDMANNPKLLLDDVLDKLDPDAGNHPSVRLFVGVRSSKHAGADGEEKVELADMALAKLAAIRVNADASEQALRRDMADYVSDLLMHAPGSPYLDDGIPDHLPEQIVDSAEGSFVFARVAARALTARDAVVDSNDVVWREALNDGMIGVFRDDLYASIPVADDRARAVDLLRALAFARGRGLPWHRVWAQVANAIAYNPERTYGDSEIAWLLGTRMAGYLSTHADDGLVHYELYHDSLRAMLRERWTSLLDDDQRARRPIVPTREETESMIAHSMASEIERTRRLGRGALAPPAYVRRHLIEHASAGGVLDDRIVTPSFAPFIDVTRLGRMRSASSLSLLPLVRKARHRWDWERPDANSAALQMAAAIGGAPMDPADVIGPWSVRWATGAPDSSDILGRTPDAMRAIAVATLGNDETIVITGGIGGAVRLWDSAAGIQRGDSLLGHEGAVLGVDSVVTATGQVLGVSAGADGTVRVWDLERGGSTSAPFCGHGGAVRAVVALCAGAQALAVSAGQDGTLRSWNLDSTDAPGHRVDHGRPILALAAVESVTGSYVLAGDDRGGVFRWQPGDHEPAALPHIAHTSAVRAMATFRWKERWFIVTGDDDGVVCVWDLDAPDRPPYRLPQIEGRRASIVSLAAASEGDRVALLGCSDDALLCWPGIDPHFEVQPRAYTGFERPVNSVAVLSADPTVAVSGGWDATVRLWDLDATEVAADRSHLDVCAVAVAMVDDQPTVVAAVDDGSVWSHDPRVGEPAERRFTGMNGRPTAIATLAYDGASAVIASDSSGHIRKWNLEVDEPSGRMLSRLPLTYALTAGLAPDGTPLAISAGYDSIVRMWDLRRDEAWSDPLAAGDLRLLALARLRCADGRVLVAAGGDDRTVWLWDLSDVGGSRREWTNALGGPIRCWS